MRPGVSSMSVSRLTTVVGVAGVVAVLLAACAAWETPPAESPPPAETPVPSSHYAPPPPVNPNPDPPPLPEAQHVEIKAAIASVQLIEDCPEPVPAAESSGGVSKPAAQAASEPPRASQARRGPSGDGSSFRQPCSQSMVQLSLQSDVPGNFRIDAVRVIDPKTQKVAGTSKLRAPTRWDDGTYAPWDGRVAVKTELKISYKLGELDLARAAEQVGPEFNTFGGPFILELDVAVDGHRQTIRSSEFFREPPHMVVT